MDKENRRSRARRGRKSFLPTLVLTIILWMSLALIIYLTDPASFGLIPLFFILLFFAVLFTSSIIFANLRRGVITAIGVTLFAVLKYFGVGNIINFLLILGISISIESYIWYNNRE